MAQRRENLLKTKSLFLHALQGLTYIHATFIKGFRLNCSFIVVIVIVNWFL
jgi:hypothetical protein